MYLGKIEISYFPENKLKRLQKAQQKMPTI